MPHLSDADLSLDIDKKAYRKRLRQKQEQLFHYQRQAYRMGVPMLLVFEGWDAAGKGGVIKRITELLDPRGYQVHPTAAPTKEELAHHYLWRFWQQLPRRGNLAIFDRSWYGRVMVERIEGFCTTEEWQRAFDEINQFEKQLTDDNHLICKYFLHFDKETQLERFKAREQDPLKAWKLTEEDWRNRDKWDDYCGAINDMLHKTHSSTAPWMVVPSVSKKWARIAVIEDVIKRLQEKMPEACAEADEIYAKLHPKRAQKNHK